MTLSVAGDTGLCGLVQTTRPQLLSGTMTWAENVNTAGATGGDLSCVPVIAGSVCDLSAKVGVPVAQLLGGALLLSRRRVGAS